MINIRVILLSFMCGSLIKPYSGYVTFFSVYSACLSFHFDFGACQLCCLIDLTLCKISQAMVPLGPWLSSPDSVHSLTCRGGGDPGSTRGLRVSDLLPFLYVIRSSRKYVQWSANGPQWCGSNPGLFSKRSFAILYGFAIVWSTN